MKFLAAHLLEPWQPSYPPAGCASVGPLGPETLFGQTGTVFEIAVPVSRMFRGPHHFRYGRLSLLSLIYVQVSGQFRYCHGAAGALQSTVHPWSCVSKAG